MDTEAIYHGLVDEHGWSPDELSPDFELDVFLEESHRKAQAVLAQRVIGS